MTPPNRDEIREWRDEIREWLEPSPEVEAALDLAARLDEAIALLREAPERTHLSATEHDWHDKRRAFLSERESR